MRCGNRAAICADWRAFWHVTTIKSFPEGLKCGNQMKMSKTPILIGLVGIVAIVAAIGLNQFSWQDEIVPPSTSKPQPTFATVAGANTRTQGSLTGGTQQGPGQELFLEFVTPEAWRAVPGMLNPEKSRSATVIEFIPATARPFVQSV